MTLAERSNLVHRRLTYREFHCGRSCFTAGKCEEEFLPLGTCHGIPRSGVQNLYGSSSVQCTTWTRWNGQPGSYCVYLAPSNTSRLVLECQQEHDRPRKNRQCNLMRPILRFGITHADYLSRGGSAMQFLRLEPKQFPRLNPPRTQMPVECKDRWRSMWVAAISISRYGPCGRPNTYIPRWG